MKDIKNLAKELRMILYRNCDCDTLTTEFERVLQLCGCEYEVNIMEDDKVIIIDLSPCIQYIKIKRSPKRIYEVWPEGSPLQKYSQRSYYDRKTKTYAKETLEEREERVAAGI